MPGIPDMIGLLVLLVLSPLYMGIAQRVKARCQGRHGPGWTQPYWRLGKTWHKETTVPEFTSWVFRVAPAVSLAALLLVLASVPVAGAGPAGWPDDVLTVFFLLAVERFWVGLAGLDAAGAFGGLGASRVATLGAGVEPALLAAFGILFGLRNQTVIVPLAARVLALPLGPLPWALAVVSYGMVVLAEAGRLPVDNPDTHLELTMMHEAAVLEYNGRLLALSEVAAGVKLTALLALGWVWLGPHWASPWDNLATVLTGVAASVAALGAVESRFVKLRYFQLPGYVTIAAGIGTLALYLAVSGGIR
jgi:formate hydrogenlyase subunit 4